jgi:hypothetical protein
MAILHALTEGNRPNAEEIGRWRADGVSQGRPFSGTGAPWANSALG